MDRTAPYGFKKSIRDALMKSESFQENTSQKLKSTTENQSHSSGKQCLNSNSNKVTTTTQEPHRNGNSKFPGKQPHSSNKFVSSVSRHQRGDNTMMSTKERHASSKKFVSSVSRHQRGGNTMMSTKERHASSKPVHHLDYRSALMHSLPEKSKSTGGFRAPPENVQGGTAMKRQANPSSHIAFTSNNYDITPLKKQIDTVVFTRDNQPVYSLTLKSDICKTCGPLRDHVKIFCPCNPSKKPIVRPSGWEIYSHPLVQKNLKDNGFSDSDDEDADSDVMKLMNLAATFVPNKNFDLGNRAYKRQALIDHERKMHQQRCGSENYGSNTTSKAKDCDSYESKTNCTSPNKPDIVTTGAKPPKKNWVEEFGFRKGPMKVPSWDGDDAYSRSESWGGDGF